MVRPRQKCTAGPALENLHTAYQKMACLDCDNPLSLAGQQEIHRKACASADFNIHRSPDFVLWHRAFLHFHERILGRLISQPDFRLLYWGWDSDSLADHVIPTGFAASGFPFCSLEANLYRSNDTLDMASFSRQTVAVQIAGLAAFLPTQFSKEFAGDGLHKRPHNLFGYGVDPAIGRAAGDPLFYAHHSNIDRLADGLFQLSSCPDPSDREYEFYDEEGTLVRTTLYRFKSISALDYSYEEPSTYDPADFSVETIADLNQAAVETDSFFSLRLMGTINLPAGRHAVTAAGEEIGSVASLGNSMAHPGHDHQTEEFSILLPAANVKRILQKPLMIGNTIMEVTRALIITPRASLKSRNGR